MAEGRARLRADKRCGVHAERQSPLQRLQVCVCVCGGESVATPSQPLLVLGHLKAREESVAEESHI